MLVLIKLDHSSVSRYVFETNRMKCRHLVQEGSLLLLQAPHLQAHLLAVDSVDWKKTNDSGITPKH